MIEHDQEAGGGQAGPGRRPPAPLPTAKVPWYYMHEGQRLGPVSEDHLKARIAAGKDAHW